MSQLDTHKKAILFATVQGGLCRFTEGAEEWMSTTRGG